MNDELNQANSRGLELGRRHAALAEVIGEAALWARSFRAVISDVLSDRSAFVTSPLVWHADYLTELWNRLGGACVDLASSLDERMAGQHLSMTTLRDDPADRHTSFSTGAAYVRLTRSRGSLGPTLQDLWRREVTHASLYLSVAGVCTGELERYFAISQALFDDASAVVKEAYASAVAATYGRIWARASEANEGRVLLAWMNALADGGFSFDECVAELRDLSVVSPEAMSYCLDNRCVWLPEE